MENTDCNLSEKLAKAAITEAPAGGDVQANAPAKYQPDPSKILTGSKLLPGIVQVDDFIDFPLISSKAPEVLFPARSGAKTQPEEKIGSSSNHDVHPGFSFDRNEADSSRGVKFIFSYERPVYENDEADDEDEDLDISQLLMKGPVKGYLVPEAHVPADVAGKSQPNWPEKYESDQIKLPSSSKPPSHTVNKDEEDSGGKAISGFKLSPCSNRGSFP